MKFDSRKITLIAAWALTIVIGVMIGRKTSPTPTEEEALAALRETRTGSAIPSSEHQRSERPIEERPSRDRSRSNERIEQKLHDTLANADRVTRTRNLLRLIDTLSPDEFHGVIEAFRADGLSRIRGSEYSLLINAWVQADPYAAVEYIAENDDSGNARRTAITAWAAMDPHSAAAWVDGREDEGSTNDWTVGLITGIASTDPELARQTLEGLESGRTRSTAMTSILPYVMQNGFEYASDWIASIADEDLQRGTARRAARDLTRQDPEQAGTWVSEMASVPARRDASEEVSDEWARRDLESARRWAENLPEDTRTEAAEGIARQMARQDPERTADWLNSLGDNPDLDGARRIFLSESTDRNPQVALENVYTLSKESDQARMYGHILSRWSRNNQDDARLWVLDNSATLPDNVVKKYAKQRK